VIKGYDELGVYKRSKTELSKDDLKLMNLPKSKIKDMRTKEKK
jgi:hypothetical protein